MTQILPHVKPTSAFRSQLKQQVLAEFALSQKPRPSLSWFKWLVPAVSFAAIVLVVGVPLINKRQEVNTAAELDNEMATLEQQLLSDPELDAAIDFQEI